VIAFIDNPELFTESLYSFADNIYSRASIFYSILSFFGLPANDIVGLATHLIGTGLTGWSIYLVFHRHFSISEKPLALLATVVSAFLIFQFMIPQRSSFLTLFTFTPSGVSHLIGFASIYFILSRNIAVASVLVFLSVAISAKGNFILIPILLGYVILDPGIKKSQWWYTVLPIAYPVWALHGSSGQSLPVDMFLDLIESEQSDGVFSHLAKTSFVLFSCSLVTFPLVLRRLHLGESVTSLAWSIYWATLAVFLFNIFYMEWGYHYLLISKLVIVGFPQATKYFGFIFSAIIIALVIKSSDFRWYEKASALLAVIIFKAAVLQIIIAAGIVFSGIILPRWMASKNWWHVERSSAVRFVGQVPLPVLFALALTVFVTVNLPRSHFGPFAIDPVAFSRTNLWSAMIWADEKTWRTWEKVREIPDDFVLFALYHPQKHPKVPHRPIPKRFSVFTHSFANIFARKSLFVGQHGSTYEYPARWDEAMRRRVIRDEVLRRLVAGKPVDRRFIDGIRENRFKKTISIKDSLVGFLESRKVKVLVPSDLAGLFPNDIRRQPMGEGYFLLHFESDSVFSCGQDFCGVVR